ncbi:hypothetical protein [Xanthomonas campestris]|uniref:hypothetical protein n=1 Tax=Xanthomonas campestris TaxID=339 RepID=UPI002B22E04D|nr:hypothetical protein [Xanthomonas campestris]MEA9757450.1 hypothetical protein [Xanthomonas campestris pv. raphani]MEA9765644.1 hypothetical protein [Xanthomonas campestris pv. raphani]MEA9817864.1 hypothetical protein [Xanthomonas campestris pv. raphani]MEA9896623.1 hypothetical protein [Xanthomonas campestris pv. raphani]MEA9911109.1 hypothetical protein [Xanthomonas campestris pv. raphani]
MTNSNLLMMAVLAVLTTACAEKNLPVQYSQFSLSPLSVHRQDAENVRIDFKVPLESLYYVAGANYEVVNGSLSVRIIRCSIHEQCKAMVDLLPGLPPSVGKVVIPFSGNRVRITHSDGIQSFDI